MPTSDDHVPPNPQTLPIETVEALENEAESEVRSGDDDGDAVPVEDVASNPDTDELEGLPGPSEDAPSESSG